MNVFNSISHSFRSSYMMMIPLSIIFQSCLGSIAALYILKTGGTFLLLQLGICISVTMVYNASVLAQMKTDLVFKLLLLSVVVNLFLLCIQVF